MCKLIRGIWVPKWENCGAACLAMRDCKAWTFTKTQDQGLVPPLQGRHPALRARE